MSKKFYVPIEMTRKYVRENEIYEKIDGQLIRITPQMISEIVLEGRLVEVHFIEVDNEECVKDMLEFQENMRIPTELEPVFTS